MRRHQPQRCDRHSAPDNLRRTLANAGCRGETGRWRRLPATSVSHPRLGNTAPQSHPQAVPTAPPPARRHFRRAPLLRRPRLARIRVVALSRVAEKAAVTVAESDGKRLAATRSARGAGFLGTRLAVEVRQGRNWAACRQHAAVTTSSRWHTRRRPRETSARDDRPNLTARIVAMSKTHPSGRDHR